MRHALINGASFLVISLCAHSSAQASLLCSLGAARCIISQNTKIPVDEVLKILDSCERFTFRDVGRQALRMSYADLNALGGKRTPISIAWFAFGDLYDSPLQFERKKRAEDTSYAEVKRSCLALERDFNDDSKWTR